MKTKRLATTLERGSVSVSSAHAAGLVSRMTVRRHGLCSVDVNTGPSGHLLRRVYLLTSPQRARTHQSDPSWLRGISGCLVRCKRFATGAPRCHPWHPRIDSQMIPRSESSCMVHERSSRVVVKKRHS